MEPKFFQEKQISYLLGKAQNATKLVKNTSSKSLEEKNARLRNTNDSNKT